MTKRRKPVDIYVRVSRVGGRENLISPEEQERRGRQLADERGLKVGIVLQDLDESGGKWDRPGLQKALERVRRGESGGLIVAWLDRLSRDSEHALRLVRELDEAGGAIFAPDAPADWQSPEGELQASIMFSMAAYMRKRARAGFERAKERSIASGVPVHTRPAVGYRKGPDRHLEPDPEIAPIVREVFERRAVGEGPAALGAFLQRRGVKTSQGSRTWSKQAVYGLLSNRVYLGEISYGRDRRYVNIGAHTPIVDLALWQAAQHPNGRRLATPSLPTENLLVGLLRCAGCRYSLQATTTSRGKRIYRCTRRHAAGICPEPAWIDAATVEALALEAFWSITNDVEAEGSRDDPGEVVGLERDLERAQTALDQWTSPDVQDAIGDIAEYAHGLRERRQARDAAAEALGRARAVSGLRTPSVSKETLRGAWERMITADRRELLSLRFDCIALRRDRRIVVYPAGTGPANLPRRGFTQAPVLEPFPDPPDRARVLALQPTS